MFLERAGPIPLDFVTELASLESLGFLVPLPALCALSPCSVIPLPGELMDGCMVMEAEVRADSDEFEDSSTCLSLALDANSPWREGVDGGWGLEPELLMAEAKDMGIRQRPLP